MKTPTDAPPLLVLGGEHPGKVLVAALGEVHSTVVAIDAGALILEQLGLEPDLIVGDMDSVAGALERFTSRGVAAIVEPDQGLNDLEKGLAWAHRQGIRSLTVIGVGGGMFDHAINNISILARWSALIDITIVDRLSVATPVRDVRRFRVRAGERVSLIPLPSARLTTEGLMWELIDELLELGVREGASNCAVDAEVVVRVHDGCVLVFHYPDEGPLASL